MADFLVAAAVEVAKCLVAPLRPRCGYVTSYDSHVRELEHEANKLDKQREKMKESIDEAKNDEKTIKVDVENWAKEAETDANDARLVLENNKKDKTTCFYGWLPNPKARYRLGREAKRIAERIQKRIELLPLVNVYDDAPLGLIDGAPGVISLARETIFESRDSILSKIMSALDDEKNKVIGIHGPGGVGKTTLLETVEKKLKNEKRLIAKAEVSKAHDLKNIQVAIAQAFRLNQKDPSKKVLVILDDLWKELDLGAVGIPLGDESSGCQVLLTSRDKSVLQKTGASLIFRLDGLSKREAFRLFETTYGPDKLKDEGYEAKAAQVVTKLAGLPLLIKSVASTLKYGDESTWENALIKIEDPNIKAIVEWSYGQLHREETKSLFLLCGFIGGSIPVELLLGLGMDLGLFRGFDMTIRSSRNKLNEMLRSLRSICLLQDGSDDEENVTIHDLYSKEVILTPLTGENSLMTHHNAGPWPKEKLEKCWVCLVNVGSHRLSELSLFWSPTSKIFMLSKQDDDRDCDGLDFTSMKELRVLFLCSINFTVFRSLDKIVENLRSLYLHDCNVEDVAILGNLKALQILSFARSSIYSLPKEIGKLTKLKLLDLSYCWELQEIEPGVFKGLINLEELYMRESFQNWMDEGEISLESEDEISSESCNAKIVELKSLTNLTALEISIPDPNVLFKDDDLPFGDLIRFWINIGNADEGEFKGLTTTMLKLKRCDGILSKELVQKTLHKTQYLQLEGLSEFKNSAYELCSRGFLQLKHLEIQSCTSIKHIVSSSNGAFPLLESLFLENLPNLEKICDGPRGFSKLKAVRVTKCDRLEYFWCLSQMHRLAQLEEIKVYSCDSMRAIVIDNARKDIIVADDMVEFHNIRCLELDKLPKMTSFCIEAEITLLGAPIQVNLPRLDELRFVSVGSFKSISTIIGRLHNIRSVRIENCPSLESVFECRSGDSNTEQTSISLPDLTSVYIKCCPSLESVFDCDSLTEHKIVSLPKLKRVDVSLARVLRHVVKSNSQTFLGFPSLEEVSVEGCFELRYLFPYGTATTLEKLKRLHISNCEQMKEVVAKEEGGRSEAGVLSFPFLTDLIISECPNFGAFIPNPTCVEKPLGQMAKENDKSRQPFFNEMVCSIPCRDHPYSCIIIL